MTTRIRKTVKTIEGDPEIQLTAIRSGWEHHFQKFLHGILAGFLCYGFQTALGRDESSLKSCGSQFLPSQDFYPVEGEVISVPTLNISSFLGFLMTLGRIWRAVSSKRSTVPELKAMRPTRRRQDIIRIVQLSTLRRVAESRWIYCESFRCKHSIFIDF